MPIVPCCPLTLRVIDTRKGVLEAVLVWRSKRLIFLRARMPVLPDNKYQRVNIGDSILPFANNVPRPSRGGEQPRKDERGSSESTASPVSIRSVRRTWSIARRAGPQKHRSAAGPNSRVPPGNPVVERTVSEKGSGPAATVLPQVLQRPSTVSGTFDIHVPTLTPAVAASRAE